MAAEKTMLVIGAGDATGGAIARRFAREGYVACVTRRTAASLDPLVKRIEGEGGKARAFGSNARKEEDVVALFETIEREVGPLGAVVFNVGGNVRFPIRDTTARVYTKVWEMCALGGFLVGREAAKVMVPRQRGTILFTGATASLRGASGYSAFSGGKAALRALAQSMGRELGPEGIHVGHVVIDGAIDTAWGRANFPRVVELKDKQGVLSGDSIAENYWMLHNQPRDAWTHELDLRPWMEKW